MDTKLIERAKERFSQFDLTDVKQKYYTFVLDYYDDIDGDIVYLLATFVRNGNKWEFCKFGEL